MTPDVMAPAPETAAPVATPAAPPNDPSKTPADVLTALRSQVEASKSRTRNMVGDWQKNIDYRRGKPFEADSDTDRIAVNIDFPFTKAKQASLFSQVPQIILTPKNPMFAPAAAPFTKAVNDTLERANVATAMDECLPDMINAAGFGAVIVTYNALTAMRPDPVTGLPVRSVRDTRYAVTHIEPEDLLRPLGFKGSDFNQAPWIGRRGRMTWAEALRAGWVTEDQKDEVLGDDEQTRTQTADERQDVDKSLVVFDEIYYWRYLYHPEETSFSTIQRVVFVHGIEAPVVDTPWEGQQATPDGSYVGSCYPPIQVGMLTHISGDAIPPSDSAVGRPQVDELNRTRSQFLEQRKHSIPLRYYDVLRIDPTVRDQLQRGDWQGMIPVQGDGSRAIGEVARAQYPQEDFAIDRIHKQDLQDAWGLGANQIGNFASGERSASEAAIVQSNTQTRIGYERAQVTKMFVRVAEVMAGLLAIFGEFDVPTELAASLGQSGVQGLQAWNRKTINQQFAFDVRADASVLLDSEQRVQRLLRLLNYTAKMPGADVTPIVAELISLTGLNPADILKPPPPPPPQQTATVSFTAQDLTNPLVLAILKNQGTLPDPSLVQQMVEFTKAADGVPSPPPAGPPLMPGGSDIHPPSAAPAQHDAQPAWALADRLNTRREGQV